MPGTLWHCLGFAGMQGMALAVGLSTEHCLHHPALMQGCSGNVLPPWHPGSCATCRRLRAVSRAAEGSESCRRDILAFVEVFAQHFVTCLCQCQTHWRALVTPMTHEHPRAGCSLPAPQIPHWCHIPGTCCCAGNPLLPPLLHCRILGTSGCHSASLGCPTVAGQCHGGYFLTTQGIFLLVGYFPAELGISLLSAVPWVAPGSGRAVGCGAVFWGVGQCFWGVGELGLSSGSVFPLSGLQAKAARRLLRCAGGAEVHTPRDARQPPHLCPQGRTCSKALQPPLRPFPSSGAHVAPKSSRAKFQFLFPSGERMHRGMWSVGWGMRCPCGVPSMGGRVGDTHLSLSEDPMSPSDVPQVTNATDILFEAGDEQQLNCWTAEIRECVRRG